MYLRVDYGDNDYGHFVTLALKRIWADVHEHNAHCIHKGPVKSEHFSSRSLSQMFKELHKAGVLLSWITRAIDCEYHWSDIEYATRCLYWVEMDWKALGVTLDFESICTKYLSPEVSIHRSKAFAKKWSNGESAWLDLETGEAESF